MSRDLSGAFTLLIQDAKEGVADLFSHNIEIKSSTSTIEFEELLFEVV